MTKTIIFVYNANSGFMSGIIDSIHKTVSPETYKCNLCALTYGNFSMRKDWKSFIEQLKFPVEFLHKDEFIRKFKIRNPQLPAVYIQEAKTTRLLIKNSEINKCKTIEKLKKLVKNSITNL